MNTGNHQQLLESAHDGIFLMSDTSFIECNSKTLEMFACEREDIIGKTPVDFSPEFQPDGQKTEEMAIEKIQAAYAGEPQFFEWRHTRLDGTPFDAEISLNKIEFQDEVRIQAIVRDVSDRKRSEEAIKSIARGVSGQSGEIFFQEMVKTLGKLFNAKYSFIGLLDEEDKQQVNTLVVSVGGVIASNMSYNLNDISKDNPDVVLDLLCEWQAGASDEVRWITGHALRTLVKQGCPEALALLGYPSDAEIAVHNLTIEPQAIAMGEKVTLSFDVESLADDMLNLMIDYVVYHMKANGTLSPKVFKLTKRAIQPGEVLHIERKHSFAPVTTRRYYAGEHAIEPKINGRLFGRAGFVLEEARG